MGSLDVVVKQDDDRYLHLPNGAHQATKLGVLKERNLLPIAIVGMACRLPGGVSNVDEFWELCAQGRSGWSEIPKTRFNPDAFYHPNPDKTGCFNAKGAHFLEDDIACFDAPFFRLTANEAKAMDPQHRLLLECTYEALENGGFPLHKIAGQKVGVFAGQSFSTYAVNLFRDLDTIPTFQTTGCADSLLSNRISYLFDLRGPSATVDTACSSSLSALHLACQSLRSGESDQAIVGSCHLLTTPDEFVSMSAARLFSDEGKSYSFDHRATGGYGRGEGAGCIILKPLPDALAAGDSIRAVIRNTGMNQDGRTPGITVPSSTAQEALIQSLYTSAGLDPLGTRYVESHGTGTAIGDPIEASVLCTIFGNRRPPSDPVFVGSVKSNIGHLEGASGVMSVIKTAMMLEKGFILPNCDFEKLNPKINLSMWNLQVPTSQIRWPNSQVRRASVNNFGFGGANAHVIMEEPPSASECQAIAPRPNSSLTDGSQISKLVKQESGLGKTRRILVLSATAEESLKLQVGDFLDYLRQRPEVFYRSLLGSLALTLGQRRSNFPWRIAMNVASVGEAIKLIQRGDVTPKRSTEIRIGFMFTGQGSQWYAMGRELMQTYPNFASTIETADGILRKLGAQWSLTDELMKTDKLSLVQHAYISQPACTAIQIALVDLLSSWDIHPHAVAGHSSGEIAAAYATGSLDLESCMLIAYHRGTTSYKLKAQCPKVEGAMVALGASSAEIQPLLDNLRKGHAVVACINSPSSVTVSGDAQAVAEVQMLANERDIFNRRLHVDTAYHSHHMILVADDYAHSLKDVKSLATSGVEFHSSLTGQKIETSNLNASYWVQNLTSTVQFSLAVESLCNFKDGNSDSENRINTLIEIGPHSALAGPIKQILASLPQQENIPEYFPTLVRNADAVTTVLDLAAALFVKGCRVNLAAINFPVDDLRKPALLNDLPAYPWNHKERYWYESRISHNQRNRSYPRNDVLGVSAADYNTLEPRWRNVIRLDDLPWLRQHKVLGNTVYPWCGYLAMAIEAAYQRATSRGTKFSKYMLREISISRALILSDTGDVETMVTFRPYNESTKISSGIWDEFRIFSWSLDNAWTEHCRGLIAVKNNEDSIAVNELGSPTDGKLADQKSVSAMEAACTTPVNPSSVYSALESTGIEYGPLFKGLADLQIGGNIATGNLSIPDIAADMPHQFENKLIAHPVTLDTCTQIIWAIMTADPRYAADSYLPSFIKSVSISHDMDSKVGGDFRLYGKVISDTSSGKEVTASTFVVDPKKSDEVFAMEVEGIRLSRVAHEGTEPKNERLSFMTTWKPHYGLLKTEQFREITRLPRITDDEKMSMGILEQASFYFVDDALRQVPRDQYLFLQDRQKKLYNWMEKQITLHRRADTMNQSSPQISAQTSCRDEIHKLSRSSGPAGVLVCTIGEKLPEILRGEVEPLSLIYDGVLDEYYKTNKSLVRNYSQAAVYVDLLAHQNPHIRILEIGAGTGGATAVILENLRGSSGAPPRFLQYDYTDMSGSVIEKAKARFIAWGELLTYQKLDVEKDPLAQGFKEEDYDLIVAADVLQATIRVKGSIQNIRKLLKPGGKLLMIEETVETVCLFPFATLPGWWSGEEAYRQDSPVLVEEQWDALLKETGFSGLDFSLQDFPGEAERRSSMMISTAKPSNVAKYPSKITIVSSHRPRLVTLTDLEAALTSITGSKPTITLCSDLIHSDLSNDTCIFLDDLDDPLLARLDDDRYQQLQKLCSAEGVLWLVQGAYIDSTDPNANMALGLARSIRSENAAVRFATLDLDKHHDASNPRMVEVIVDVFKAVFGSERLSSEDDLEFSERDGLISVPRIIQDPEMDRSVLVQTGNPPPEMQSYEQEGRPLKMAIQYPGSLDSFYFVDDEKVATPAIDPDEVEILVKANGLNFKDIMVALGQIDAEFLGGECSGIITKIGSTVNDLAVGDRVCALCRGVYSTYVRCTSSSVAAIPQEMSYSVAASIPAVYCTAYYSLFDIAHLCRGESILIHAAAGGVGQAAIFLSKMVGAEIFATVGSAEKKEFLKDTYGIPEDHIFYSRNTSFKKRVQDATGYRGVDVVLNSLGGDALRASWECLAAFGRFIEIGKRDILSNTRLEMAQFAVNATFASVDLALVLVKRPQLMKRLMTEVMNLHREGLVKPVSPITIYPISEVEAAFRTLQGGKSIGKIVVEPRSNDQIRAVPQVPKTPLLDPNFSYLITGGSGGLGRSMTRYLVQNGARYIILASRRGLTNVKVQSLVDELGDIGAKVVVYRCDVGKQDQVEKLVHDSSKDMPPIRGVIHGAMVLHDVLFEQLTFEEYISVIKPKVDGAWNLHHSLSSTQLDFFVILSSVSGTVGNRGQAPYAAASTFFGAFAQWRSARGLPTEAIHLGPISEVGYVAENTGLQDLLTSNFGDNRLNEAEFLAFINCAIRGKFSNHECITSVHLNSDAVQPFWAPEARFSHCRRAAIDGRRRDMSDAPVISLAQSLRQVASIMGAQQLVYESLANKFSSILLIPLNEMSPTKAVVAYGLDSLVAVEIRNWLTREMDAKVQLLELIGSSSLTSLAQTVVKRSGFVDSKLFEGEAQQV